MRDKYYRTTNLNMATFLFAKDQIIVGVNPINDSQKEFAFVLTPELEELSEIYKFGDSNDERRYIEIRKYEQARNSLLDLLKN
ncbi:MAG: hypothetical protein NTV24_05390 [Candidatus Woesebacteria bacterium]|nr:hypothetical protein [Candidatus Woesebacteria bacterium]